MNAKTKMILAGIDERYDPDNDIGKVTWVDNALLQALREAIVKIDRLEEHIDRLEDRVNYLENGEERQ